ncbi:hypothetical protein FMEAI12_5130026 [Parafrankia sp. Ea1.12]|nr:hypothetical protein FMEAI12_5130026 [Parafrankia sp. Ea1.12]
MGKPVAGKLGEDALNLGERGVPGEACGEENVLGVGEHHAGDQGEGMAGTGLVEAGVEQPGEQRVGRNQDAGSGKSVDQERQRGLAQQHTAHPARVDADGLLPAVLGDTQVLQLGCQGLRGDELEELLSTGHVVTDCLTVRSETVGDRLECKAVRIEGDRGVDDHLPVEARWPARTAAGTLIPGRLADVLRRRVGAVHYHVLQVSGAPDPAQRGSAGTATGAHSAQCQLPGTLEHDPPLGLRREAAQTGEKVLRPSVAHASSVD